MKCKKGKSWTEHGIQCFLVINTNFSVEMIQYFTQKGFSGSSFLFQCNVTVMMVMLKSGRNTAICWTYITNHHEEDISGCVAFSQPSKSENHGTLIFLDNLG